MEAFVNIDPRKASRRILAATASLAVLATFVSFAEARGKGDGAVAGGKGGRKGGTVAPVAVPVGAAPVAAAAKGGGGGGAGAVGGSAQPPQPLVINPASMALIPAAPAISFSGNALPNIAPSTFGFDITGFIQDATVDTGTLPSGCLSPGGSVRINGLTIKVPCNTILQFPANTLSWSEMFTTAPAARLQLGTMTPADVPSQSVFNYPSTEISIAGNVVGGVPIAGLIGVSQQSLNTGSGFIVSLDYAGGAMVLSSAMGGSPAVRVEINDPVITNRADIAQGRGRYTAGQSPDPRYSVDQANPTIKTLSGYPMCIPSKAPTGNSQTEDRRCPDRNRPLGTSPACRSLAQAGIVGIVGPDIMPFAQQLLYQPSKVYCTGFVMKYTIGTPEGLFRLQNGTSVTLTADNIATALEPDSREMVPFKVGDHVTFAGTLLRGSRNGPNGTDTISAHTIEGNLAVYTAPSSLPSYVAIDGILVGSDVAASGTSINGIPQEAGSRFVAEAVTTDVTSILDIYLIDLEPSPPRAGKSPGQSTNRWVTPHLMTSGAGAIGSNGQLIDGGVTTQATGPQAGRARLRANLVIAATAEEVALNSLLASPTRYFRAVVRSMCDPANINGSAAYVNPSFSDTRLPSGTQVACLDRVPAANGLMTGSYLAPTGEFIFPENTSAGGPLVPYDFWKLGFLANGEGGSGTAGDTLGPGKLIPPPW
jgi:hypothetical protein